MSSIAPKNALDTVHEQDALPTQAAGATAPGAAGAAATVDDIDDEDLYVPETQLPAAAAVEAATTREEVDLGATTDDAVPGTPPRVAKRVLEPTPSRGQAQADARSAKVASENKTRWNSVANGGTHANANAGAGTLTAVATAAPVLAAPTVAAIPVVTTTPAAPAPAPQAHTIYYGRDPAHVAADPVTFGRIAGILPPAAPGTGPQQNPPVVIQSASELLRAQSVPGLGLINAPEASLPSRPLGAPRTTHGLSKRPEQVKRVVAAGAAAIAQKNFIKSEPLSDYLRRETIYPRFGGSIIPIDDSPSRASSSASSADFTARPPFPFAQPLPRFTRSPTPGPSSANGAGAHPEPAGDDLDDRMAVSDHGDPADDVRGNQAAPPVPRTTGVPPLRIPMTERILNTARRVAPELGHSTVPVDAYGDPKAIDGLAADAHLAGIPTEAIDYWLSQPGENVVFELYSINGRRANTFSVDDQIEHMQHLLDCMFLADFPDERPELGQLFSPPSHGSRNATRVRPCMLMGHGFHVQEALILRSYRFWTVANSHFLTHGVTEPRSKYVTSFGNIRCASLDDATKLVRGTVKDAPTLREFLASRLDVEDPAVVPAIAAYIADNCIEVTMRQVRPAGQLRNITQYSIFADVSTVLQEEDFNAFDYALRRMVIWHHGHGLASYLAWNCRWQTASLCGGADDSSSAGIIGEDAEEGHGGRLGSQPASAERDARTSALDDEGSEGSIDDGSSPSASSGASKNETSDSEEGDTSEESSVGQDSEGVRESVKKTAAYLRLASENMKGRGSPRAATSEKWHRIADDMRSNRIGMMALQETHLSEEHVRELELLYGHLRIFNTPHPDNATGAGGVAIVLNKQLTNYESATCTEVVPGRAILCRLEWHRGGFLNVLAVYAPTDKVTNGTFWKKIRSFVKKKRHKDKKPDVLLGDFNQVEDAIDRFPARMLPIDAPDTFDDLKRCLKVTDGWRDVHPGDTEWTWRNADRSLMSRLDRIYLKRDLLLASRKWDISVSNLTRNDHSRVSVEILNPRAPEIGPGRWTMRPDIVHNETFLIAANKLGTAAREAIEQLNGDQRTASRNAQTVWKEYKDAVRGLARRMTRESAGKRRSKLASAEKARDEARARLSRALTDEEVEQARAELRKTETAVQDATDTAFGDKFFYRRTRVAVEAEAMTKSWFGWTKMNKVREPMFSLRKQMSDPPVYVSASRSMAEMAKEYHDGIQLAGIGPREDVRAEDISQALDSVDPPDPAVDFSPLSEYTCGADVTASIESAKLGSAAGVDGFIYEYWMALNRRAGKALPDGGRWEDIAGIMAAVFQDIEKYGVCEGTDFTEGWMCPLYKKGDRTDVANYRPITLLNTDYKLFTKSLATKLARIAPKLIHPDQAGFVSGRSITDQTKLTSLILSYAEAREEDGMIVALDQEKAYDRIRHDYLKLALRKYGLPELFVNTIGSLYEHAETSVMINGFLSSKFRVTRGVRQGDPLSCLLFNIAIEPLPNLLRKSALRGYEVRGLAERLIATLYADDTTVYLSAEDNYQDLLAILDVWCHASGAKFNVAKTEIIPLGRPAFREKLWTSRKPGENAEPIPEGIRIAKDGEVTRILGSWPGNGTNNAAAWAKILENVQNRLDAWERFKPTLQGRSIISRAIIGGCTQYLTAAQGMPSDVERRLDRMTLRFLWGGSRRHPINMETLRMLPKHSGLNLLCAQERNDAQYLVWLSAYLGPLEGRPKWAFVADGVFEMAMIAKDAVRLPTEVVTNPFHQGWRPNYRKLPLTLRRLVLVAKKYALVIDDPYIPEAVREDMLLWTHPAVEELARGRKAAWRLRCLRVNHAVYTLEDLDEIAIQDDPSHRNRRTCSCSNCLDDRREGCGNPAACQTMANDLLAELPAKWGLYTWNDRSDSALRCVLDARTEEELEAGETATFDRGDREPKDVWQMYRVMGNSLGIWPGSAREIMNRDIDDAAVEPAPGEPLTVYVCSAIDQGQTDGATGGFAAEFENCELAGLHGHLNDPNATHASAAINGIQAVAEYAPRNRVIHMVTNSLGAVRALTTQLDKHERLGWTDAPELAVAGRHATAALRARAADTTITYVNKRRLGAWPEVLSARQAAQGAALGCDEFDARNTGLAAYDRPGVQLVGLTQRVAHRAIKASRMCTSTARRATTTNLARIQEDIRAVRGTAPRVEQIWEDLQREGLSRGTRNFLWKAIHGAHKVGDYFNGMPEPWKSYGRCETCGVPESMEHVLLVCPDSGQQTIWALAREFLARKLVDVQITLGLILGCCSVQVSSISGSGDVVTDRAFKIVISESAFLAWKIRCEHRIQHESAPEARASVSEVANRWEAALQKRMDQDLAMSRFRRLRGKRPQAWIAKSTWKDTTAERLDHWRRFYGPGVFVSMGSFRASLGIG